MNRLNLLVSRVAMRLTLLTLAAACGGGSGGGSAAAGGGGGASGGAAGNAVVSTQPQEPNYRPCPRGTEVGEFTAAITVAEDRAFTTFQGSVKSGVNPLDSLVEIQSQGACRLLNRKNYQCPPACDLSTHACGASGCVPMPTQEDAGTLTVTGIAGGLTVTPSKGRFYSNDGVIPFPGIVEGQEISLTASGAAYPAFVLATKGIAPIEVITTTPSTKRGSPLSLAWKPPGQPTGARVHILVSLDHHGGTPQQLECDAPDTGTFEIPASLLDALSTLGVSGFPTLTIARRAVESKTVGPGCVELNVVASKTLDVEVEGFKSCKETKDCPQGQTCQEDQSCK